MKVTPQEISEHWRVSEDLSCHCCVNQFGTLGQIRASDRGRVRSCPFQKASENRLAELNQINARVGRIRPFQNLWVKKQNINYRRLRRNYWTLPHPSSPSLEQGMAPKRRIPRNLSTVIAPIASLGCTAPFSTRAPYGTLDHVFCILCGIN